MGPEVFVEVRHGPFTVRADGPVARAVDALDVVTQREAAGAAPVRLQGGRLDGDVHGDDGTRRRAARARDDARVDERHASAHDPPSFA